MTSAERAIAAALIHLAAARDLLKVAKAPRSLAKVRAAITSAQGAERHAKSMGDIAAFAAEAAQWPNHSKPLHHRQF